MKLPAKYQDRRICIIGLGYVGLTLAVAMAEAGFEVTGVERDAAVVDSISQGRAHFSEAGLDPRLAAQVAQGRLRASVDWPEKGQSSVFVVTVGTPLGDGRVTNLGSISAVASRIAELMTEGAMIVLRSTVRVGVSRGVVKPLLDSANVRYDLAFCPERTLEGRALVELRSLPQIIGGIDEDSALRASHMFNFLTPTTIRVRDLETAEMIKLINNTQRDLMFAFANEVAEMCDAIGVSAVNVISAGNMGYARASMPMPGPVGGPCLEKDPYILAEGVELNAGAARLALMGRTLNEELPARVVERVRSSILDQAAVSKIAIAGLAFKGRPETSDLRGSMVIPLIAALTMAFPGVQLYGYDPAVSAAEAGKLGVIHAQTPNEAFDQADCVIFQNNNERFGLLDMPALSQRLKPDAVIYDMWNQFDAETLALRPDVEYFGFGTLVLRRRSGETGASAEISRA